MIRSLTVTDSNSCAPDIMVPDVMVSDVMVPDVRVPDARVFSSIKNEQKYPWLMTVWYTKGIYVSFVNCFVVILPLHKNFLLLALTLIHYDRYSITGHPN
jgi:hypothetical protein